MMPEQQQRERFTAVWLALMACALVGMLAWSWPDLRIGWQASASARASLGAQP